MYMPKTSISSRIQKFRRGALRIFQLDGQIQRGGCCGYNKTLQLQRFFKKGCQVYVIFISDPTEVKGLSLDDYRVPLEYADVFPKEVLGLPSKREIDFTIDLMSKVTLVFKVPYCIRTSELVELKM